MENRYLLKYAGDSRLTAEPPDPELQIIVVIPAYAEPDLLVCLDSLRRAHRPAQASMEILVVINYPESAGHSIVRQSQEQWHLVSQYNRQFSTNQIRVLAIVQALPDRQAGVGLARKIGMDEAVRRFDQVPYDGLIVNLDADCRVDENYFLAIIEKFRSRPEIWAASIDFEHPLADPGLTGHQQQAIIEYELHLRYFIEAQRYVALPFAYQTVGSCMVVRSSAYQKMGGMNIRQAGEDFYFLHKFIAIGRLAEINETTIFPSARDSFRVPFGTGRAIGLILNGSEQKTYSWDSFLQVKQMVDTLESFYHEKKPSRWLEDLPRDLSLYLLQNQGQEKLEEIIRETTRYETFRNRFFQWFNAFRLMKFLNGARTQFPDRPVMNQALDFQQMVAPGVCAETAQELLLWYRKRAKRL